MTEKDLATEEKDLREVVEELQGDYVNVILNTVSLLNQYNELQATAANFNEKNQAINTISVLCDALRLHFSRPKTTDPTEHEEIPFWTDKERKELGQIIMKNAKKLDV